MIDYEATMQAIGNDRSLFETLVQIFVEDYPALVEDLGQAVMVQSHEEVYSAAHRLKGLVSNFHAKEVVDILGEIETSARLRQTTSTAAVVQHISMLCTTIAAELKIRLEGT